MVIDTNHLERLFYTDAAQLLPYTATEQVIKDYGRLVSTISHRYYETYFYRHPSIDLSEVTQVAFEILIRDILPKYNPDLGSLRPFIIFSLQRSLMKYVRSERRKTHLRLEDLDLRGRESTEESAANEIQLERVISFLEANFSLSTQRIFKMFFLGGVSRKEIAEIEGITLDAVQLRIAKTRKRIAAWFAQEP